MLCTECSTAASLGDGTGFEAISVVTIASWCAVCCYGSVSAPEI